MKKCSKCNLVKEFAFFSKGGNKDGFRSSCKKCCSIEKKIYRENNKEKIAEYRKEYYILKEKNTLQNKKTSQNKKKYICSGNSKDYYKLNKEKLNKEKVIRDALRRKSDVVFKFKTSIKSLIRSSFKRGKNKYKKNSKTESILGCTVEEFRVYIQSLFTNGMALENHGEWHLDHIIPLSTANNEEDIIKLNHYTNFQPLWAKENLSKSNKIIEQQLKLI